MSANVFDFRLANINRNDISLKKHWKHAETAIVRPKKYDRKMIKQK